MCKTAVEDPILACFPPFFYKSLGKSNILLGIANMPIASRYVTAAGRNEIKKKKS